MSAVPLKNAAMADIFFTKLNHQGVSMNYLFFPGCAAEATAKEALETSQTLFNVLDVAVREEPAFSCCGARVLDEINYELNLAVNARNFAIAQARDCAILTICNTCYLSMQYARHELDTNPELLARINKILAQHGLTYDGGMVIHHLISLFTDDRYLPLIQSRSNGRFQGKRILPFYGCHNMRPNHLVGESRMVETLDGLLRTGGAEIVKSSNRCDCCGFHTILADSDMTLPVLKECLDDAGSKQVDYIVTPCTLCHINLDLYQKETKTDHSIGVLHLSQYALAVMGYPVDKLGTRRHLTPVRL